MRKTFGHLFLFFFVSLIIISCKHDPIIDITPPPAPPALPSPPVVVVKCSQDTTYFQNEVLPLFVSNCAKSGCHNSQSQQNDVILNNYNNIMNTGQIVPGNPEGSKAYEMIIRTGEDAMPPQGNSPLTNAQILVIRNWILQGALNNHCDQSGCDTINISYSGSLKGILQLNCQGCHSGSNPPNGIDLTNYTNVKAATNPPSGRLIGSISHSTGYSPMPKGGVQLTDCQITMFKKWIVLNYPQ